MSFYSNRNSDQARLALYYGHKLTCRECFALGNCYYSKLWAVYG